MPQYGALSLSDGEKRASHNTGRVDNDLQLRVVVVVDMRGDPIKKGHRRHIHGLLPDGPSPPKRFEATTPPKADKYGPRCDLRRILGKPSDSAARQIANALHSIVYYRSGQVRVAEIGGLLATAAMAML